MLHILAERRGFEPLRRCRRSRISNPAPYLLGQRSMWRRLEDLNPHTLAGCGFLDRCNSRSASSRRMLVGRAGFEPAAFPMSLIYSQFPSPVWIPTHVVGGAGCDPALQRASHVSAALPAALFLLARHREHLRTWIRIVLSIIKIPQVPFKTRFIKT